MTTAAATLEPPLHVPADAASPPLVRTGAEIYSIQILRAFAALLVVFHHAHEQFPWVERVFPTKVGHGGVDLFFVISGFVMTYTTALRDYSRREFLVRRVVRVMPLYWVMTLFTAGLLIAAPSLVRASVFTWESLWKSLAFIPHANPGKDENFSPLLKLGWTLNYEMFFYLVFALFLPLRLPRRVLATGAVFAVLSLAVWLSGTNYVPLLVWGRPIVFEFVIGCLLGWATVRGRLAGWSPRIGALVMVAGFVALFAFGNIDSTWRLIFKGLPAAVIVLGALMLERAVDWRRWRLPLFLGDASYSLYLGHGYVVIAFRVAWEKLHLPAGPVWAVVFVGGALLVGTVAGVLLYLLVEKPMTRALRGVVRRAAGPR